MDSIYLFLLRLRPECSAVVHVQIIHGFTTIGYFIVVYLVAKPLIWSEAEGDLVVIETSV